MLGCFRGAQTHRGLGVGAVGNIHGLTENISVVLHQDDLVLPEGLDILPQTGVIGGLAFMGMAGLGVGVSLGVAKIGVPGTDVVQHAVRAQLQAGLGGLLHLFLPQGRAGAGQIHGHGRVADLTVGALAAVGLSKGNVLAPDRADGGLVSAFLKVEVAVMIDQRIAQEHQHLAALSVDILDALPQQFFAAHAFIHPEIGPLAGKAAFFPPQQVQSLEAAGLQLVVHGGDVGIAPVQFTVVLLEDQPQPARHVPAPFGVDGRDEAALFFHEGPVQLRARMPVAQMGIAVDGGHGEALSRVDHGVADKAEAKHVQLGVPLDVQAHRLMGGVLAGAIQALAAGVPVVPLHGGRVRGIQRVHVGVILVVALIFAETGEGAQVGVGGTAHPAAQSVGPRDEIIVRLSGQRPGPGDRGQLQLHQRHFRVTVFQIGPDLQAQVVHLEMELQGGVDPPALVADESVVA